MPWADDAAGAERLARLVPLFAQFCADPDSTEARMNPHDGRLRLDTWSRGLVETDHVVPPARVEMWLNVVATAQGRVLGPADPLLAAELPDAPPFAGARLQAFAPPVTGGGYAVVIRKRPTHIPTLDEYVERGRLPTAWRDALGEAVERRQTTVITGPTGSGKSTLLGAMTNEVVARCPDDRLVLIEDTAELRCAAPDHLALRTTTELSFAALIKATLRASPTRIILGEVRDEAALDFLDANATGHPGGLCTTHAGSALEALHRLDRLAQRANVPPQRELIGEAVRLVVVMAGGNQDRRITDLVRVDGYAPERGFALRRCTPAGTWTAPERLSVA
jgi:type IV secretion system protein TrbB